MTVVEAKAIVVQSFAKALERMAFLDVMPYPEIPPAPTQFALAEIRFGGPAFGSIQVAAGFDFARELASNMGLLDQPTEYQCLDAIKELVNVTSGLVLPLLATPDMDVSFVTPRRSYDQSGLDLWIRGDVVVLEVGGYPSPPDFPIHNRESAGCNHSNQSALVDDSAIVRKILSQELASDPGIDIVGTAWSCRRDKIVQLEDVLP
jgi:hypothetical protein